MSGLLGISALGRLHEYPNHAERGLTLAFLRAKRRQSRAQLDAGRDHQLHVLLVERLVRLLARYVEDAQDPIRRDHRRAHHGADSRHYQTRLVPGVLVLLDARHDHRATAFQDGTYHRARDHRFGSRRRLVGGLERHLPLVAGRAEQDVTLVRADGLGRQLRGALHQHPLVLLDRRLPRHLVEKGKISTLDRAGRTPLLRLLDVGERQRRDLVLYRGAGVGALAVDHFVRVALRRPVLEHQYRAAQAYPVAVAQHLLLYPLLVHVGPVPAAEVPYEVHLSDAVDLGVAAADALVRHLKVATGVPTQSRALLLHAEYHSLTGSFPNPQRNHRAAPSRFGRRRYL